MTTVGPGEAGAGVGTTHGFGTLDGDGMPDGVGAGTTLGDSTAGAGEALVGDILGAAGATPASMAGVVTTTTVGAPTTITIITEETTLTVMRGDVEDTPLQLFQAPHLGEGPT